MPRRAIRCEKCREDRAAYCPHRGVLLEHLGDAAVAVVARHGESQARTTFERIRSAFETQHRRAGAVR